MSATEAADVLRLARMTWRTEKELQDEIGRVLTAAGIPVEREVELHPGSRIDFVAGRTGIEVKTQGSPTAVARQLQRYAHSDRLDELLLATTRPHHATGIPGQLAGMPVRVVVLQGGAW